MWNSLPNSVRQVQSTFIAKLHNLYLNVFIVSLVVQVNHFCIERNVGIVSIICFGARGPNKPIWVFIPFLLLRMYNLLTKKRTF